MWNDELIDREERTAGGKAGEEGQGFRVAGSDRQPSPTSRLSPDLHRELVRLEALDDGLRRALRCEVRPNGDWAVSCRSAHRWGPPERILADLRRLPDGAGWKALWEALFSWPESRF